ncbi:MAG: nucleoside kinase [Lachnospiraceae bacterium]|nr:nucleoside kinase [Lachnospiraceae bacterium]
MQVVYEKEFIDVKSGTEVFKLLEDKIDKAKYNVIACRFNNEIKSLNYKIESNGNLELVDISSKDGMRIYTRGLMFIIGKAFNELYKEAYLTINYQLSNAMFCQIDNMEVTEEMIKNVKQKVQEIVEKDLKIDRKVMTREEAVKFYEKEKTLKGRLQLDIKETKSILLYSCEDYYNYFYGVMPISTGVINVFDIEKYKDGFLVRYPSREEPTKLQKYEENKKLLSTLMEYDELHKVLNVDTVYKLNKTINENKITDYILLDEALHEKKIVNIANEISKRKDIKIVLIAGPSSSGKTTFAKRLGLQLYLDGLKPVTISVDNYFVEREENPKDEFGNYDFETLDAIDTKLFNEHLLKLFNGEEIDVPSFNFMLGKKEYKGNKMKLNEGEILIVEGIHCLNDKLTINIPKEQKYKVYISALTVLNIDYYNRISTTDTRLVRRIVRDHQFRGYSALHTLQMWDSVNRGEQKNIFAYQEEADAMFNSSLIYEFAVLKNEAMPLLEAISASNPEYSEARRLHGMLKYFMPIPSKLVPATSLLREFVGGSIFGD